MLGKAAVDAELNRSLGLTIKEIAPILAVIGGNSEPFIPSGFPGIPIILLILSA
jgi:hypothetical protein